LHHAFRYHAFQEESDGAFASGGLAYFGAWGEDAQVGVGGDLFDDFDWLGSGVVAGGGFGEVEAGDLEAVEEEAGAAGVEVVGGDAAENFADGLLDGGTVFRQWKVEAGSATSALVRIGDGFSGGVVVVAEASPRRQGLPQRWPSVKMWRHWYCLVVGVASCMAGVPLP
jgi:hypothetical protein